MKNQSKPKLVIVLGMHRSGTSLLAKGMESLGYSLGNNLMLPGDANPKGFWEDKDIVDFNDGLLRKACSSWDFPSLLFDEQRQGVLEESIEEGKSLLKEKLDNAGNLVIKDPRLSILLPYWLKVLEELSIDAKFILAFRNPLDVASSLHRRDIIEVSDALQLWSFYNSSLLTHLPQGYLVVDYHRMLSDGAGQMERIAGFIGSEGEGRSELCQAFLRDFLDSSLCHSQSGTQETLDSFESDTPICTLSRDMLLMSRDEPRKNLQALSLAVEWEEYQRGHSYFHSRYRTTVIELEEKKSHILLNEEAIKELRRIMAGLIDSSCDFYFIDLFFRLVTNKIFDIQLYGAGEGGQKLLRLIELSGQPFTLHTVLDKKARSENLEFAGHQVVPPEEMMASVPNIVIASKAYHGEIVEELKEIIKERGMEEMNLRY